MLTVDYVVGAFTEVLTVDCLTDGVNWLGVARSGATRTGKAGFALAWLS